MNIEKDAIIQLNHEDGSQAFEFLMAFDYQGKRYAALQPLDEEDGTVAIMEIVEMDDESVLETIEDEMKAKALFVHFVSLWETED